MQPKLTTNKAPVQKLRSVILDNLPPGFKEEIIVAIPPAQASFLAVLASVSAKNFFNRKTHVMLLFKVVQMALAEKGRGGASSCGPLSPFSSLYLAASAKTVGFSFDVGGAPHQRRESA